MDRIKRSFRVLATACFVVASMATGAWADPITEIVAFGDSLTDTGNFYNLTGNALPVSPPYFNGRLSNGPVWVERLADRLGVPDPFPSRLGGTNNAYAGALTNLIGSSLFHTPNIGEQVNAYLTAHPTLNSNQLIVVWGGANDFIAFPSLALPDPAASVTNLATEITQLAQAGGTNFLVPNLPPLGETPYVKQKLAPFFPGIETTMNTLTVQFNTRLAAGLDSLEMSRGITIHRLDVYSLFQQALTNPGQFGLTNVTDQAKSGDTGLPGVVVPNPDQYLFWDDVHPTRVGHQIIGDQAFAAVVPEPSSVVLMISGGIGLLGYGWHHGRRPGNRRTSAV